MEIPNEATFSRAPAGEDAPGDKLIGNREKPEADQTPKRKGEKQTKEPGSSPELESGENYFGIDKRSRDELTGLQAESRYGGVAVWTFTRRVKRKVDHCTTTQCRSDFVELLHPGK